MDPGGVRGARLARVITFAALASLAASIVAPAGAAGSSTHAVRISTGAGDPNSLNIHLDPSAIVGYISELSAAYFVRYDNAGRPIPELITEIPSRANGGISADGKTITWRLRHGVKWSDGEPFSSRDVAFSVRTILNPKNNEAQGQSGWDNIVRVRTPNPDTAVFDLKRPYSGYLPLFFGTAANEPCLLPEHILGKAATINDAPYNAKPVGIGPFRVTAWRRGDAIDLEANPYYWRGKPKLDRITWKLLASQETLATQMQTGEVDLWPNMPPSYTVRMKGLTTVDTTVQPNFRATRLTFNLSRPLVRDVRVRRAIRDGVDRKKMVEAILHGYGYVADGIAIPLLPPPENGASALPFAPAAARKLLDAAGWKPGDDGIRSKGGTRLALDLIYPIGAADLDETVEFMRAQLREIGVDVTSRKFAPNLFRAPASAGGILYGGKWDLAVYPGTLEAVSDVIDVLGCQGRPPGGENASLYCNPGFDAQIDSVLSTYDVARQRALFAKAQQTIVNDVPDAILYMWKGGYAVNRRVSGYHPPVLTPFDDMMNVDAH